MRREDCYPHCHISDVATCPNCVTLSRLNGRRRHRQAGWYCSWWPPRGARSNEVTDDVSCDVDDGGEYDARVMMKPATAMTLSLNHHRDNHASPLRSSGSLLVCDNEQTKENTSNRSSHFGCMVLTVLKMTC